jgi:hypothetical protein
MREAGPTSTEEVVAAPCCARPTGDSHARTYNEVLRNASEARAKSEGRVL